MSVYNAENTQGLKVITYKTLFLFRKSKEVGRVEEAGVLGILAFPPCSQCGFSTVPKFPMCSSKCSQ